MDKVFLENEAIINQNQDAVAEVSFFNRYTSYILPIILLVSDYVSLLLAEETALFLRPIFNFASTESFNIPAYYQYIFVPAIFLLFSLPG